MRSKRRSATRAVRHYFITLIYQSAVEYALKAPPLGLYIIIVISDVRMLHVSPVAYHVAHLFPKLFILPDALFALLDERLDTVFLYLLLSVHAEGFLHFQLYRKSVRVPPCLAQNVVSFHRLVARYYILHDARKNVTYMRLSVSRRWSVIKGKLSSAFAGGYTLVKDVVLFPEFRYLFLSRNKIQITVYFFVHIDFFRPDSI